MAKTLPWEKWFIGGEGLHFIPHPMYSLQSEKCGQKETLSWILLEARVCVVSFLWGRRGSVLIVNGTSLVEVEGNECSRRLMCSCKWEPNRRHIIRRSQRKGVETLVSLDSSHCAPTPIELALCGGECQRLPWKVRAFLSKGKASFRQEKMFFTFSLCVHRHSYFHSSPRRERGGSRVWEIDRWTGMTLASNQKTFHLQRKSRPSSLWISYNVSNSVQEPLQPQSPGSPFIFIPSLLTPTYLSTST
jgi:hypothetical protein